MSDYAWTEQQIEDWVVENPQAVWDQMSGHIDVVARQLVLPGAGRLDVLLQVLDPDHRWRLVVVEIKRGVLDVNALVQLLGYMDTLVAAVPESVRVSGVLFGRSSTPDLLQIRRHMQHVHLAYYQLVMQAFGPGWLEDEQGDCLQGRATARGVGLDPFYDACIASGERISARRARVLPVPYRDTPQFIANGRPKGAR